MCNIEENSHTKNFTEIDVLFLYKIFCNFLNTIILSSDFLENKKNNISL